MMNTACRLNQKTCVAIFAALFCVVGWSATFDHLPASAAIAASVASDETHDVVTMRDGRVLSGQIVEETADHVVFLYVDPVIRIQSRLTLQKRDIASIERDVQQQPAQTERQSPAPAPTQSDAPAPATAGPRGLAQGDAHDEDLPSFYVIPMKGQMGTDIRLDVYASIIADIRAQRPDIVVWKLDCTDVEDKLIPTSSREEQGVFGEMVDDYRLMVQRLQDELRGIRQVMWVQDAYGVASVMALAWEEMYMAPNARLVGMSTFFQEFGGDADVKAKMREYWFAAGNSFLQRGNRALELGYGLMDPDRVLSASWRGRDVVWRNDLQGEYIVNSSTNHPATFRAKTAEDFRISKGTVDDLDELALLLGYREYRVLEGDALNTINRYVINWRRDLENVWKRFDDYQRHMGWATGDQAIQWLGRARSDLEYIVQAMRRYPAIELRARMRGMPDRLTLELQIEEMQRRIADLRRQSTQRGGGRR